MRVGDECAQTCDVCKRHLIMVRKDFAVCPKGHGKLTTNLSIYVETKSKKEVKN